MAGTGMRSIDTSVIREAATSINNNKNQLSNVLKECKKTVSSLGGNWTGDAAETTISAFNTFYAKYSELYEETLNKYVKFLNDAAGAGYEDTENTVKRIGDSI